MKKRLEPGEMVTWIGRPHAESWVLVGSELPVRAMGVMFTILAIGLLGAFALGFEQWWAGPDRWTALAAFGCGALFFGGTGWLLWRSHERERQCSTRVRYVHRPARAHV